MSSASHAVPFDDVPRGGNELCPVPRQDLLGLREVTTPVLDPPPRRRVNDAMACSEGAAEPANLNGDEVLIT